MAFFRVDFKEDTDLQSMDREFDKLTEFGIEYEASEMSRFFRGPESILHTLYLILKGDVPTPTEDLVETLRYYLEDN